MADNILLFVCLKGLHFVYDFKIAFYYKWNLKKNVKVIHFGKFLYYLLKISKLF